MKGKLAVKRKFRFSLFRFSFISIRFVWMSVSRREGGYFPWKQVASGIPEAIWAIPSAPARLAALKSWLTKNSGVSGDKIDAITESSMEHAFTTYVNFEERKKIAALRGKKQERKQGERNFVRATRVGCIMRSPLFASFWSLVGEACGVMKCILLPTCTFSCNGK